MTKEKIARINELARESKIRALTEAEAREQAELRQEYINEIRLSFGATLENTVIKRPDGTVEKVKDRNKSK